MSMTNGDKVRAVLKAVKAQDPDEATRYVARDCVQHFPHIGSGVDGLRKYIVGSTSEQLQLAVVRIVENGPYVVTQLQAQITGEHMFAVYRFAGELIAEHWAFSSPDAPPNKSGHTQLDGPTQPSHLNQTERNAAFLRRYYETFHLAGDHNRNEEFFTGDVMIRHEPGVRDGLGEFLGDVAVLMQHRTIDEIKLLVGEGDLVFVAAKGTHEGKLCAYIDLYRIEQEKVVEHWGFPQMIPPRADSLNRNEML